MVDYVPGRYGCLITDVRMPGHSGLDLLRWLRNAGSAIPVIIVTADADPTTRSRAMQGGALAYLIKPVSSETLLRHLQSALGRLNFAPRGNGGETPSDG